MSPSPHSSPIKGEEEKWIMTQSVCRGSVLLKIPGFPNGTPRLYPSRTGTRGTYFITPQVLSLGQNKAGGLIFRIHPRFYKRGFLQKN